ncbi:MAG: NADP oxidoreductase [Chloroflexota bacterium]|nr:NADP oxidoreductase [Chloroflexota bacterium]MDE2907959.1 NADP oxidoreductase [Chloroflexota bacterium]
MTTLNGKTAKIRVAIIGSGPSGFYAADQLLKQREPEIFVDMYERLPTPFGLVRGGVAPDHAKIKSVTKLYSRIASHERFSFFGNVEFGTEISRFDLSEHYHGILYAVGAQTDRKLGIAGEDMLNSYAATEFVGWYNGHPDYRAYDFDLSGIKRVAVIGVGNVAMDVARILARTPQELYGTDIADYALDALRKSDVEEIYVLGRRGPAQAAFTNPEIKELGEMADADIIVDCEDASLDELSATHLKEARDRSAIRNVKILQSYVDRGITGKSRRIIMRFLVSPSEIIGNGKVEAMKIVKNELVLDENGNLRPRATDQFEVFPVDMIFRSVGYRGVPLRDVPFYDRWGTIPNDRGRVLTKHEGKERLKGNYVVGWIKRGPSGIIGTNKPDAIESTNCFLDDLAAGDVLQPSDTRCDSVLEMVRMRKPAFISFDEWKILDEIELRRGIDCGRSRVKFTRVEEMLEALGKTPALAGAGK